MNRYYEHPTEKNFRSPVYNVRAVPVEKIVANSYNPNVVAPPEMKLLELSIWEDGYTMPCVCYYDAERDRYELVDGYHRYLVLKTSKRIYERERGPAARHRDRKGPFEPHGLDHPPQPGAGHAQRRADERDRRRTDPRADVRPVDHAPYRHGPRRTASSETDHGPRRTLRRQGVQPRQMPTRSVSETVP